MTDQDDNLSEYIAVLADKYGKRISRDDPIVAEFIAIDLLVGKVNENFIKLLARMDENLNQYAMERDRIDIKKAEATMSATMQAARNNINASIDEIKRVLDNHQTRLERTLNNSEHPTKKRLTGINLIIILQAVAILLSLVLLAVK